VGRETHDKRRTGNTGRLRKGQWPDGSPGFATIQPGPFATYGGQFYANGNTTFVYHRRPRDLGELAIDELVTGML
jgi:hypothetical protein